MGKRITEERSARIIVDSLSEHYVFKHRKSVKYVLLKVL